MLRHPKTIIEFLVCNVKSLYSSQEHSPVDFRPSAFICVYLASLSYFKGRGTEAQRGEGGCPRSRRTGTRTQAPNPQAMPTGPPRLSLEKPGALVAPPQ